MSIYDDEIKRRQLANATLIKAGPDIEAAIVQFTELDTAHKANEQDAREELEAIYKESRHYTGKQPKVFSVVEVETYPFFGGPDDTDCNPYFPISKVKNKTFDGLAPLNVLPTKTGAWARDVVFSPIEKTIRDPALAAVQAFPDISGESGSGSCSGETPPGSGTNETICTTNGGVWTPPTYGPGSTATEKLKDALDAWKPIIESIVADLYNDSENIESSYWQNILSKVETLLAAVQTHVSYPSHTDDFLPGSPADLARDYLIANISSIEAHVNDRKAFLNTEATNQETAFFGIIKLRHHQANGSFAKLQAAKTQKTTNQSIMDDNTAAIDALNALNN
jgi:hypothetical protein